MQASLDISFVASAYHSGMQMSRHTTFTTVHDDDDWAETWFFLSSYSLNSTVDIGRLPHCYCFISIWYNGGGNVVHHNSADVEQPPFGDLKKRFTWGARRLSTLKDRGV